MASNPTKQNETANCDDWTKIAMHCLECGAQFFRKVKGQRHCDEHRHLAGSQILPKEALTSKNETPRYMCIRVLLDDGETEKPTHFRVVDAADYDSLTARLTQAENGFNSQKGAYESLLGRFRKACGRVTQLETALADAIVALEEYGGTVRQQPAIDAANAALSGDSPTAPHTHRWVDGTDPEQQVCTGCDSTRMTPDSVHETGKNGDAE